MIKNDGENVCYNVTIFSTSGQLRRALSFKSKLSCSIVPSILYDWLK